MPTALCIDDNVQCLASVGALLTSLGFSVDLANDAMTGLAMLRKHDYDAVVTDYQMPDMDGLEVAQRSREISEDMRVILMTGVPRTSFQHKAGASSADAILWKPFTVHEVREALGHLVTSDGDTLVNRRI